MHGRSGREFFENAAKVISRLDARDERAVLAYVYGFCCHFALDGMIKYNKLLIAPSHLKRYLIYALLGITGNYKEMHGLLVNYKANPQCADSTEKLYKLYDNAVRLAVRLIGEFRDSASGALPFNKIYDYTFGGKYVQDAEGNVGENVVMMDRKAI